jgi:hypothetical protein
MTDKDCINLKYSLQSKGAYYCTSSVLDFYFYFYCDRFDGTSDMNAATQGSGTDFGSSYATVIRIHGT